MIKQKKRKRKRPISVADRITCARAPGAVFSIVATEDGKFLASGGTDGTRIWSLQFMTQILNRPATAGLRGATTAITWANRDDDPSEMLFYGTLKGYLIGWQQVSGNQGFHEVYCRQLAQPAEITALAFDPLSNRLAVCNYNSSVQVYVFASSVGPRKIFAVNINNFIPKALHFGAMRRNDRELLVSGLRDGKIFSRTLTGSMDIDSHTYCISSGDAAVDTRRGAVCIDDTESGAILYRLDDHQRIKTFPIPRTKEKRPRQVRFVDDSKAIVIGSDHGIVYIFDRCNAEIIDKLMLKGEDWVQTIAVRNHALVHFVPLTNQTRLQTAMASPLFLSPNPGRAWVGTT
ncbi:WD40-repeat-containing domain protein [Mycena latifolia]|nr:WD40-repeat-containing domain protein [Mycena latifolia]